MATVSLRDLTKSFGAVEVIKGVSLSIEHGEFVALVGPSGCGKSTLLRLIAGLEEVTGGEIEIDGSCVNHVPSKARDIAMVFQNYALYPHMTVEQNMGFSLKMQKVDKARAKQRVADAAELLNLAHLLDRYPRQLSGGQRQRVAMGRAIVREPRVFLFDEPLSNLDAKLRVQVRGELRQLHRRVGVTSIYVTHDQIEAMTMADRIVVLRDGNIEQVGTPIELYDQPVNTFVATFIGSPAMTLLDGVRGGGALHLDDGTAFPIGDVANMADGTRLTVGIRPEDVEIASDDRDTVPATLIATEMTGSETMVLAELSGKHITILTKERIRLAPGSAIRVRLAAGAQHYFDADGQRLSRA